MSRQWRGYLARLFHLVVQLCGAGSIYDHCDQGRNRITLGIVKKMNVCPL